MDWKQKMEQSLNQGYDVSRKLFGKAKKRATELGEHGVLSLEVRQLETKHTDLLTSLGGKVYDLLVEEKRSTVTAKSQGVKELLEQINETREELDRKRHLLQQYGESHAASADERSDESRAHEEETTENDREQASQEEPRKSESPDGSENTGSNRTSEGQKTDS